MGKPVVLCILDGWGIGTSSVANAPALANVPNFNRIWATCPHAQLITHGPDAGLPRGQMGNSEVGHTNIGAGRVVAMDLGAIDLAVEDGSFALNEALVAMIATLKENGGTAHLMGVVSDGGVHGHITHLIAAMLAFTEAGVPAILGCRVHGPTAGGFDAGGFDRHGHRALLGDGPG
jgi:2,3-bisphosphoglycerate-independent phosphoglycerate mutase